MKLDVARLLHDLGGPTEVVEKLRQSGYSNPPGIKGVEKWRERGSIPTRWVIALNEVQRRAGRRRIVLEGYVVREDGNHTGDQNQEEAQ